MTRYFMPVVALVLVTALIGCKPSSSAPVMAAGSDVNLADYETQSLSDGSHAVYKMDADGNVLTYGIVRDGVKNGVWVEYHPKSVVKSVSHFINGSETGPRLEFSTRGQLEKQTTYKEGQIDGKYGEYKFGRYVKEAMYKDGQLDGAYKEYFANKDNVQKLVEFKNGKQDGKMQYFDEEGNVTLEYDYKNGEKVAGGLK